VEEKNEKGDTMTGSEGAWGEMIIALVILAIFAVGFRREIAEYAALKFETAKKKGWKWTTTALAVGATTFWIFSWLQTPLAPALLAGALGFLATMMWPKN
jgi:hypothetical protein